MEERPMLQRLKDIANGVKGALHSAVQSVADPFIDTALDDAEKQMNETFALWQRHWKLNLIDSITLESAVLGIALVSHFLWQVNDGTICIISFLVLGLIVRSCVIYAAFFYRYWQFRAQVRQFAGNFFRTLWKERSFESAVKNVIRSVFDGIYNAKVSGTYQRVHAAAVHIGVPSKDAIAARVTDRFYLPVRDYVIKMLLYQIGGISAAYLIFLFVLKQYVFGITVHLSVWQVIFFPFTTVIPELWRVIAGQ